MVTPVRIVMSSWRDDARCLGMNPELFELRGESANSADQRAINVCAGCRVARECLDDALDTRAWGVVRGGIALARPMRRRQCVACGRTVLRLASHNHLPAFCTDCKPLPARWGPFLMTGAR
jgi:hypothetical protein